MPRRRGPRRSECWRIRAVHLYRRRQADSPAAEFWPGEWCTACVTWLESWKRERGPDRMNGSILERLSRIQFCLLLFALPFEYYFAGHEHALLSTLKLQVDLLEATWIAGQPFE